MTDFNKILSTDASTMLCINKIPLMHTYPSGVNVYECIHNVRTSNNDYRETWIGDEQCTEIKKVALESNKKWGYSHKVLVYDRYHDKFYYADSVDDPHLIAIPEEAIKKYYKKSK